jgi:hypothetical protein
MEIKMEEHRWVIKQFCQPAEVYLNKKLSWGAKALFSFIVVLDHSIDGCFASNAYLAGILGVVIRSVERFIDELIEHGYITRELILQNDRTTKRILRIDHTYKDKYWNLVYNCHCKYVWKTPEEMVYEDQTTPMQEMSPPLTDLSPPPDKSVIQKEYIKESEKSILLLRNNNNSFHAMPQSGISEVYKSKLIRRPASLIKQQSTVIKKEAKPVETELHLSDEILLIVDEWENGLSKHRRTSKTFKQAIFSIEKLLNGKMFNPLPQFKDYHNRKFTHQEIITTIANFKLAALSPEYRPEGELKDRFRKTVFADFFYNSHSIKLKSLFIEFLNNPPKMVVENTRLIPDAYPQLSQKLRKLYVENVLGNPNAQLLPQSENAFRRAAMKLQNFKDQNKKRILITEVNGNLANYLWEALENKVRNTSEITPHWFCSDKTFQETFPAYLYSQGVLQSLNEREFSIYN